MSRVRCLVVGAALATVATGCGSASSKGASVTPVAGCAQLSMPPPRPQTFPAEPPLTVARVPYTARIVTNCGTITVAMDAGTTPSTVNSFAFLASKHYLDGSRCHRLTTAGIFVLQCGDPTGTGRGDPGYSIPDENLAHARYPAGTVAMANTGAPGTGGSQFFLVYRDTDLPPQYTPFGRITGGLDVLRRIAAAGTDDRNGSGDGAPRAAVGIRSFTVTRG
ncbi:MAG: peptidylprolyl isomerase [Frankiaceae bacterium]